MSKFQKAVKWYNEHGYNVTYHRHCSMNCRYEITPIADYDDNHNFWCNSVFFYKFDLDELNWYYFKK